MNNEEPRYLAIARVLTSFGVKGALKAEILTDFPERFRTLKRIYIDFDGEQKPFRVQWARMHGKQVLIKLAEYTTPEEVARLRNRTISVAIKDAVQLPEDTYFWHQIEGLEVYTEDERLLGVIVEIISTGSNDVYVVRPAGQPRSRAGANEVLVPAIADVVKKVDLEQKRMIISPIPGMLNDAEAVIIPPAENEPAPDQP